MRRVLCIALCLLAAGCNGPFSLVDPKCPSADGWILTGPQDDDGALTTVQGQQTSARILFLMHNPTSVNASLAFFLHPPDSNSGSHYALTIPGAGDTDVAANDSRLKAVGPMFQPEEKDADGTWTYALDYSLEADGCDGMETTQSVMVFHEQPPTERAEPGLGVAVRYAGFWTNGTVFDTNIARVNDDPNITKAGWYEYANDEPLNVYVYNTSREERPQRYNASGYFTTIAGFNNALKGLYAGTSTVAYLRPEDAYTQPGREDHILYGDALVFYIELVDVVALPCPYPQPVCDQPQIPPLAA